MYSFMCLFIHLVSYLYIPSIPVTHLTFTSPKGQEKAVTLWLPPAISRHTAIRPPEKLPNLECQRDLTHGNGDVIWYLYIYICGYMEIS